MKIDHALKSIFALRGNVEHIFFRDFLQQYDLPAKITESHIMTMMHLSYLESATMSDISRQISLEKGSFTPVANRLIELGFIVKERNTVDKRVYNLSLTEKGTTFTAAFRKNHMAYIKSLVNTLSEQDQEAFFSAINIVIKNMNKISPDRCNLNR